MPERTCGRPAFAVLPFAVCAAFLLAPPLAAAEYEGREIAPDSPGAAWVRSNWERDLLGATLPLRSDWLRFFCSLGQQPGVDHSLLLSIWDAAEPDGWSPADGAPADRPYTRLRNAAALAGIGSVWDSLAAYHGVDH